MAARNSNVQVIALHRIAPVLNNADSYIFDVDHCAIGQERLVCRHGHARLNRLTAGRDPGSSAANVRPFLGAVGSAFENPGILDI